MPDSAVTLVKRKKALHNCVEHKTQEHFFQLLSLSSLHGESNLLLKGFFIAFNCRDS
jgi:hypothetical protein